MEKIIRNIFIFYIALVFFFNIGLSSYNFSSSSLNVEISVENFTKDEEIFFVYNISSASSKSVDVLYIPYVVCNISNMPLLPLNILHVKVDNTHPFVDIYNYGPVDFIDDHAVCKAIVTILSPIKKVYNVSFEVFPRKKVFYTLFLSESPDCKSSLSQRLSVGMKVFPCIKIEKIGKQVTSKFLNTSDSLKLFNLTVKLPNNSQYNIRSIKPITVSEPGEFFILSEIKDIDKYKHSKRIFRFVAFPKNYHVNPPHKKFVQDYKENNTSEQDIQNTKTLCINSFIRNWWFIFFVIFIFILFFLVLNYYKKQQFKK